MLLTIKGSIPQLRFKDDNGNDFPVWGKNRLKDISQPVKRKSNLVEAIPILTISAGRGFLNQSDRFSKVIAGTSLKNYTLLKKGELSYNRGNSKTFPYGCIYSLKNYDEALVPNVYRSFKLNTGMNSLFYEYLFSKRYADRQLRRFISSTARMDGLLNINQDDFYSLWVPTLAEKEQQKIADFFSLLDRRIEKQQEKVEALREYKKGMMQKLFSRELRFRDDDGGEFGEWGTYKFSDLFTSISTKSYQILSTEYQDKGLFEVVDQGQSLVVGYTDRKDKLYNQGPAIIYGDHTTIVKFRTSSFVIGADGTKILINKRSSDSIQYLYYALCYFNVISEGYKRHFSILKKISLTVPIEKEQQKIADFLSKIDNKIEKEEGKLKALTEEKKGFMQQMFV
ncbi:restriction endonuclease subunit S [Jeotgalibacillus marinus]|uniref:Restriction endonuclease subunit S n=1 Tax=Jeotgalibacillus marinus TaxID=86667 RepID=A0ABV3Q770_9BACL